MARYIGPVCRQCRREGMKLYLKGERCHTEKCAIERRNFIPGQHGKDRKPKIVGYGLQLREKQKVRRVYGVLERQFRNTFEKAALAKGITGEQPDVVARAAPGQRDLPDGLRHQPRPGAPDRAATGTSRSTGARCDIPSVQVKVGDVVAVRERSKNNPTILAARDATAHAPAPNWIEVDREGLKGRVTSLPKRDELVQIQLNEQLIVELYSK